MPCHRAGLLFLLAVFVTLTCSAEQVVLVKDIVIRGNRAIETDTIRFNIGSRIDAELSNLQIRRDVKALYDTGFFEDIRVESESVPGGVRLVFHVTEKSIITDYEIRGNKKVSLNTLQEKIEMKLPASYDPVSINAAVKAIRTEYVDRGFNDVSITPVTQTTGGNQLRLIFMINEGQTIRISQITIDGNEAFRDGTRFWGLRSKLKKTRERWLFSWLTTGGKYKPELFQEDLNTLAEYYKTKGYARVAIGEPTMEFEDRVTGWFTKKSRRFVKINIPVMEGDRYRFGRLDVVGNELYDHDLLMRLIQGTKIETKVGQSVFIKGERDLRTGEWYNIKLVQEVNKSFTELYGSRGYIYAMVDPETVLDDDRHIADVTWNIREGSQAYLHRLEFKGNNKTRDKVLRRAIGLSENDVFDSMRFRAGMERLNYLGYITDVTPEVEPGPSPEQLDVTVSVNDSRQTEVQLSGGYSSADRLFGTISLSEHNLFGRGQELSLSATSSRLRTTFELSFSDEYLFDSANYGSISIWNTTRRYPVYRRKVIGSTVAVGRPLFERFAGRIAYKYEINRIYDVDEDSIDDLKDELGTSITSGIINYLLRDARDNRREPTRGTYNRLSCEVAGGAFGGDNYFYKAEWESSYYKSFGKLVFMVHGEVDYADGFSGRDLPNFERYYLGGPRTLRGFQEYSIGPLDENGDNVGGNKALVLNSEFIIPIAGPLKTVLFFDAGDAYRIDQPFDLRTLRTSAGAELRFFVPAFWVPLRFIWGFNLDPYENEDSSIFEFTLGTFY